MVIKKIIKIFPAPKNFQRLFYAQEILFVGIKLLKLVNLSIFSFIQVDSKPT